MTKSSIGFCKRFSIFARDDFSCAFCRKFTLPSVIKRGNRVMPLRFKVPDHVEKGTLHYKPCLTLDHVKASSLGGDSSYFNLVTACNKCNNHKADKPLDDISLDCMVRVERLLERDHEQSHMYVLKLIHRYGCNKFRVLQEINRAANLWKVRKTKSTFMAFIHSRIST
jgi:hypothetical protein